MQNERKDDDTNDLLGLGAASKETRAMTYGADDHKAGLWVMAGLSLD